MRQLFRPLVLIVLALLTPLLPFLAWAQEINAWYQHYVDHPPSPLTTTLLVIGSLATDIFLPVPSSVVSTLAGSQLGAGGATAASFVGMSLGAVLGFAVARAWGRPIACWFSKADDLARMEELTRRLGPTVLVVTRGVPILSEAGVLLVGMNRMPWRQFLPPVLLANLGLSAAYAISGEHLSFLNAMVAAVALPVAAACVVRWVWPESPTAPDDPSPENQNLDEPAERSP
ncbi:MAG: VTT domain-containing protein [Planctomycetales bacterium]|nr:VTT domain-containing protein [Planctomycetales bacterium]